MSLTAAQAEDYLCLYRREQDLAPDWLAHRLAAVQVEIARTGTYRHTPEELTYGAKVAWRNNARCIGRIHWQSLTVRDRRDLETADAVFEALVEHLSLATNGGKIRPLATVFAPREPGRRGMRIWNPQLIRYAGYRQPDGSIVGDPLNLDLTDAIQSLGWSGAGTPFDVLPLVIQMPDQAPRLFEVPRHAVLEVPLSHPEHPWFAELGLKWHALPAISDMRLEIGGVSYTAAPFSGWYVVTEIGARNLTDLGRYNLLRVVAERMGLDVSSDRTMWKDRALVEMNVAVLSSFARAGVTMIDHHLASRQFVRHEQREAQAGRSTPAEWSWIVPPMSGSTTPVFFRSYTDAALTPNFFDQPQPWRDGASRPTGCPFGLGQHDAQTAPAPPLEDRTRAIP